MSCDFCKGNECANYKMPEIEGMKKETDDFFTYFDTISND